MNTTLNRDRSEQTDPVTDESQSQPIVTNANFPSLAFDREHGDEVEAARQALAAQWNSPGGAA